jgi:hypothetical protein
MIKSRISRRIEYDFQKSRVTVTGPWNHKDSVSAKKVTKKVHACVPLKNIHMYTLRLTETRGI